MARYTSEHEELLAIRKAEREALREKPVRKKSDGPTPAEAREAKENQDPEVREHLRLLKSQNNRDWQADASTRQSRVIKVYKHAGYLINVKALPDEQVAKLDKRFTHTVYDEKACEKCEFLPDRHGENCDNCASFQGHRVLTKRVELGEETLLSIPYGATDHLKKFLARTGREVKIINRHPPDTPLSRPIRLAPGCELRQYQREAIDVIKARRKGIIEAPPRSGKTFLSAAAIAEIGQKTLILASQYDWLRGFHETFVGSETSPAMTTCRPRQIKFCKTLKDFLDTDICLATFQQFMNPAGRRLLRRISNLFPVVCVDEVHLTPAPATSSVLSNFNSTYRWGLSGTPERKQAILMEIVFDLIGPVIYVAKVDRLRPRVDVVTTGAKIADPKGGHAEFARFVNRLEVHKDRVKTLLKYLKSALRDDHMILIPCQRVKTVNMLVTAINKMATEFWGFDAPIAEPFLGGQKKPERDRRVRDARTNKIRVLVGNIKLISVGLNIPRASMIIEYTLSSNRPNAIQRVARILTPMEDKPRPVVVFMLDESKIMRTTRRSEYWNAIHKEFNPYVPGNVKATLMEWFKGGDVSHIGTQGVGRFDV